MNRTKLWVFVLVISATAKLTMANPDLINYYEQLIREYSKNMSLYEFPKDDSDFFGNSSKQPAEEFGTFDFIVIGAGSSGSVIATRLSEISSWRVLLIEAGGEEDDVSDIPGAYNLLQGSRMNWGYLSTPQTTCCLGMKNKQCVQPRGKVLGGSSSINALMYVRGNPRDYDLWEEMGNAGWNYDKILPYFLKSENSQIYFDDYHGNDGPMTVDYPTPPSSLLKTFIEGNKELGRQYVDYNGKNQTGYARTQFNIRHGKRASGGNSYIRSVRSHWNLKISLNSIVTKILIDEITDPRAHGVEFVKNKVKYQARASKEIILSAGAINSPKILMLSGIGPSEELRKFDIPVINDLPAVGKYLKDHPVHIGLSFRSNFTVEEKTLRENIEDFLQEKGTLTTTLSAYGIGFIETKDVPNGVPDVEYMFIPPISVPRFARVTLNLNEDLIENYINNLHRSSNFFIHTVLLHPVSFGEVRLKSRNPEDFPEIDLNYFSDEGDHDIESLYRSIQFIFELTNTSAFRKISAMHYAPSRTCGNYERYSKDYWYCMIRTLSTTLYHSSGTTRMGKYKNDSVVDNKLNVHGVRNLRVADAGVMPSTVSGHTNAACFMIGERVSDLIKEKYEIFQNQE